MPPGVYWTQGARDWLALISGSTPPRPGLVWCDCAEDWMEPWECRSPDCNAQDESNRETRWECDE
jgi:hypothetical protein